MAKLIVNKINEINNEKFIRKTHVGNGCHIDNQHVDNRHFSKEKKYNDLVDDNQKNPLPDLLDSKIEEMLENLTTLETKDNKCYQIKYDGNVSVPAMSSDNRNKD